MIAGRELEEASWGVRKAQEEMSERRDALFDSKIRKKSATPLPRPTPAFLESGRPLVRPQARVGPPEASRSIGGEEGRCRDAVLEVWSTTTPSPPPFDVCWRLGASPAVEMAGIPRNMPSRSGRRGRGLGRSPRPQASHSGRDGGCHALTGEWPRAANEPMAEPQDAKQKMAKMHAIHY